MKNIERSIYIVIIVILVGVLSCGITYIVMKDKNSTDTEDNLKENNNSSTNNKSEEEESTLTDGVKLLRTYQENDKIFQEFEVLLNSKKSKLQLEYSFYEDDTFEVHDYGVVGSYKENNVIYSNIIRDNYEEKDGEIKITKTRTKDEILNINKIKSNLNENNFQIIKGEDNKNYLLLYPYTNEESPAGNPTVILVFNDDLKLISENLMSKSESPDEILRNGFTVNNYIGNAPCEVEKSNEVYKDYKNYTKIDNNKIYFLYPIINRSNMESSILEERIYTINNNKLIYKINNTYKITSICQQTE